MLNRRNFLAVGGSLLASAVPLHELLAQDRRPKDGGWIDLEDARRLYYRQNPFEAQAGQLKGTGQGRQILLWKAYEAVSKKPFVPHDQDMGDCCGQAGTLGAEVLSAVQIAIKGARELWKGKFSTEFTYAGSRVEVGEGYFRRGDGSTGAWTAEMLTRGTLLRGVYGKYDLTKYNPRLAREWGRYNVGVPDELESIAKAHPVRTVSLITKWSDACDSVANGYPVMICSRVGYNYRRDSEGFLRWSGVWRHALLLWGIDTVSKRQGGCIANSWGTDWVAGPQHKLGTPAGCFWADDYAIDAMLKQGDSYALSNFVGYPKRNLDYILY